MLGSSGLHRMHGRFSSRKIKPLGAIPRGVYIWGTGSHVLVYDNTLVYGDITLSEVTHSRLYPGRDNDNIGCTAFAVVQHNLQCFRRWLNGIHPGTGMYANPLGFAPGLQQRACLIPKHSRHHARTHLDHSEVNFPQHPRLENNTADKAGTDLHRPGPGFGKFDDLLGIFKMPALLYPGIVHARHWRDDRLGAGRQQQLVVADFAALGQGHLVPGRINCNNFAVDKIDALRRIMLRGTAQVGSLLADFAAEVIGYRHT